MNDYTFVPMMSQTGIYVERRVVRIRPELASKELTSPRIGEFVGNLHDALHIGFTPRCLVANKSGLRFECRFDIDIGLDDGAGIHGLNIGRREAAAPPAALCMGWHVLLMSHARVRAQPQKSLCRTALRRR